MLNDTLVLYLSELNETLKNVGLNRFNISFISNQSTYLILVLNTSSKKASYSHLHIKADMKNPIILDTIFENTLLLICWLDALISMRKYLILLEKFLLNNDRTIFVNLK